ncbi:MAG: thrombospondin type 3 repeat-containing protein [Planctomycetota bacterium]|jgi:hypothetical protein
MRILMVFALLWICIGQNCVDGVSIVDSDGDGIEDTADNCPQVSNADQLDTDGDVSGDACDPDDDNDGILDDGDSSGVAGDNLCTGGNFNNCDDNCPLISNAQQEDINNNGIGNACETSAAVTNGWTIAPTELRGIVYYENLKVTYMTTVTADLTINVTNDVLIEGALVYDTGVLPDCDGYSIEIKAGGDVTVLGSIIAGSANNTCPDRTCNGGNLVIDAGRDISIDTSAWIQSGEGQWRAWDTQNNPQTALPGGEGGDVTLLAGGKLTFRGSLHIGNGGDGTQVALEGPPKETLTALNNSGGSSGWLYIRAASYEWIGLGLADASDGDLEHQYLDVEAYVAAGSANWIYGGIFGGEGGDAGGFYYIYDAHNYDAPPADLSQFTAISAYGGHGWLKGGSGGIVSVDATNIRFNPDDGTNWEGRAGEGGRVDHPGRTPGQGVLISCRGAEGGSGGNVFIEAGDGHTDFNAGENGGNGGRAFAVGGDGGNGSTIWDQKGGNGGDASATGGSGELGRDGDGCNSGGSGGMGGNAQATGGKGGDGFVAGRGGDANARAGDGGDGGNGFPAGIGGQGGSANATKGQNGQGPNQSATESSATAVNGESGRDGWVPDNCP